MTHPIGYYVDPEPAIAALAEKYGQQFERMDPAEKLLTIAILADTLYHYQNSPGVPIRIIWHAIGEPSNSLRESLVSLDGSTAKTLLSLLEAMIAQLRYSQYQSFE